MKHSAVLLDTSFFLRFLNDADPLLKINDRNIIPNDTKLFAQADREENIGFYLSSDLESLKIFNLLKKNLDLKFQFLDLNIPYSSAFGVLDI